MQIGGSAQTAQAQVMPGGIQTPFDFNMTVQLQNMVDDIENCVYYGIAQAPDDSAGTDGQDERSQAHLADQQHDTARPTPARTDRPT